MLLWPKIQVIGCSSINAQVVNGVVYKVTAVDLTTMTITMTTEVLSSMAEMMNTDTRQIVKAQLEFHVELVASLLERRALSPATLASKASQCQGALKKIFPVLTTQQRWTNFANIFPERFALHGNHIGLVDDDNTGAPPETVELTHAEASANLRLCYSLCYANIQGRTLSEKHVCLLDTAHPR